MWMHKESHNQLCRDIYGFKRATYLYGTNS